LCPRRTHLVMCLRVFRVLVGRPDADEYPLPPRLLAPRSRVRFLREGRAASIPDALACPAQPPDHHPIVPRREAAL